MRPLTQPPSEALTVELAEVLADSIRAGRASFRGEPVWRAVRRRLDGTAPHLIQLTAGYPPPMRRWPAVITDAVLTAHGFPESEWRDRWRRLNDNGQTADVEAVLDWLMAGQLRRLLGMLRPCVRGDAVAGLEHLVTLGCRALDAVRFDGPSCYELILLGIRAGCRWVAAAINADHSARCDPAHESPFLLMRP